MPLYNFIKQRAKVLLYSDELSVNLLQNTGAKLVISYNYSTIIKAQILEFAKISGVRAINLHISLLPYNKGSNPNFWSFIENSPKGVSIHLLEPSIDSGGIIYQKELFFDENTESLASSYEKLQSTMRALFIKHWNEIKRGNYKIKKQSKQGSYHDMKMYNDFLAGKNINYNESIAKIKARLLK